MPQAMGVRVILGSPFSSSNLRSSAHLERYAGLFLRQVACKYADNGSKYSTFSIRSKHFPCHDANIRDFREARNVSLSQTYLLDTRRRKSQRAKNEKQKQNESPSPVLGDDPPLYDKNPGIFGRWAYFLLAFDIFLTSVSVDMVMRNWKQVKTETEAPSSPDSAKSTTSTPSLPLSSNPNERLELRPLWQRLAFSAFEISLGVTAGALILASRDRVVWRLRIQRVPINSLPPGRPGMKPAPSSSSSSQNINVLVLETASGRTKRFLMRDCMLGPGRDLSELAVSVTDIKTRFMLSMNRARVLSHTLTDVSESAILKDLSKSKSTEECVSLINTGPGADDPYNEDICDLRKVLAHGWAKAGGYLKVPKIPVEKGSWTSGPVTEAL
ncbi:hypothetical protein ACEPAI_8479 [Sanghuangporus weigelae]